jgi:hypothetical protein
MPRPTSADPVSLKAVVLPAEHGGWGLIGEPLLLALVLAPSRAGFALALASIGGFLLHHPAKLALADARRRTWYPRTGIAIRAAAGYAALALGGLGLAAATTAAPFWAPLVLAAPLAAVQLGYGARNQARQLVPELAGALALAAAAPAILLAGGWPPVTAAVVWAVLAARAAGSIIYIRARLRRDRGQGGSASAPLLLHAAALGGAAVLARAGLVPWAVAAAFVLLLARAAWGLSPWHRAVRPRTVGFQELAYGLASTALVAAGFLLP